MIAVDLFSDTVTRPTPGMRVRRATSPPRIAVTRSPVSMPDSTARASFGPMPLTAISRSKSNCSVAVANP